MSNGFYKIPRSLTHHLLWTSAKPEWKLVFFWLLEHAAFEDFAYKSQKQNVHYQTLRKGQVFFTHRQIEEDLGVSKNYVESAIKHFSGKNYRGKTLAHVLHGRCTSLLRQELRQELRQDTRSEKSIYSILCEGYFDNQSESTQTRTQTRTQTATQTSTRQAPDNYKKVKEIEELDMNKNQPPGAKNAHPSKDLVGGGLFSLGIEEVDQSKLLKKYGNDCVLKALQHITSDDFSIQTTPIQALRWACRERPWEWRNEAQTPESRRKKFEQYFKDGEKYSGRICYINSKGFVFESGGQSPGEGVKFDDKSYSLKLSVVLKKLKIQNPFKISISEAKEA